MAQLIDFRSCFIEFTTPFPRLQASYLTRLPLSLPSREARRIQTFPSEQRANLTWLLAALVRKNVKELLFGGILRFSLGCSTFHANVLYILHMVGQITATFIA